MPYGIADYVRLGFKPGRAMTPTPRLQTQKRADRKADMVSLSHRPPHLATFHPAVLLQTPVVRLDGPRLLRVAQPLHRAQLQITAGPVLRVAVCGHDPKHFDQPVTRQPHYRSRRRDRGVADGHGGTTLPANQTVALQPRQPTPAKRTQQLKIVQAAVPTVEADTAWRQAPVPQPPQQGTKQGVFAEAVVRLVVNGPIAGHMTVAVGPQKRQQLDAVHHGVVFARPVRMDQGDLAGPR